MLVKRALRVAEDLVLPVWCVTVSCCDVQRRDRTQRHFHEEVNSYPKEHLLRRYCTVTC